MKKLSIIVLCAHSFLALADAPLFSLVPQGALPTSVSSSGTVTAKYTLTNNAPYVLQNIGLSYPPAGQTPIGVTQTTGGVNSPATCSNPITLSGNGSCTLVLTISGADLIDGTAVGGPEVCYTTDNPSRCSVPAAGYQLNVQRAAGSPAISMAVGQDSTGSKPAFLVQSTDGAVTWSLGTMPGDLPVSSLFYSSVSTTGLSVAAGEDQVSHLPLIVQSTDSGVTWSVANIPTFVHQTKSEKNALPVGLFGSTCTSTDCIAVGASATHEAVIYQTFDSGSSWTVPSISGLPTNGILAAASCGSSLCFVAGVDPASPTILGIQSVPGSGVWTVSNFSSISAPISILRGAACIGTYCAGVGSDLSSSPSTPLLVYTNDSGINWSQFPLSLPLGYQGDLISISCSADICVAGGVETSGSNTPLLIQSTDGGSTWDFSDLTLTMLTGSDFESVSCSGALCVAVGADNSSHPLLVESVDAGNSWSLIDLTTIINSGTLYSVSCDGATCVVGGGGDVVLARKGTGKNVAPPSEPILLVRSNLGVWSIPSVSGGVPTLGSYYGAFANALKRTWHDYFVTRFSK